MVDAILVTSDFLWGLYALGVLVNILALFCFRTYMDEELRCHRFWYIPMALVSWPMSLLSLVIFTADSLAYRMNKKEERWKN